MKIASLIFPNQLFENNPAVAPGSEVFLVEEYMYFKQYNFHKQKIGYHRATMKFYADYLTGKGFKVNYISSNEPLSDVRKLVSHIIKNEFTDIHFCDVSDNYLERRIKSFGESVKLTEFATPMFLNSKQEVDDYFKGKKNYLQASFYTEQRRKRKILVDDKLKPIGGKWSFDEENRLKYPKNKVPPQIEFPPIDDLRREATDYVKTNYGNNYGELSSDFTYPVTHEESRAWLQQFLEKRFREFGHYEDAIVTDEHILNHGLLTPMLNIGLLTPQETVETVLEFAEKNDVPLNSTEGFIRQIIGWREFIRGVYETSGTVERKGNFFKFKRKIPESFWTGTTGIEPLDAVIKKVLKTGYCHHIERLMVVGNFMILCEFDPDDVHRWFMELFIDSYDWVMVPNVYGMSQFADGGLISTKPYISGSNYLMKMSDFEKGDWQNIWDGLFWSFMDKQRDFFLQNPRLGMLVRTFDKMNADKRVKHLETAGKYLDSLDT